MSRPLLVLTPPIQRVGWGWARGLEGSQLGQLTPTDQRDIQTIWCHAQQQKLREEGGRGFIRSDGFCLPKLLLRAMEPCFPGDGWTLPCWWEVVNQFLVWLCLCTWLLLYLLNCLYLKPQVFSLLPFKFCPPSHLGGSEWAAMQCLGAYWGQTMATLCPKMTKIMKNMHLWSACKSWLWEASESCFKLQCWNGK